MQAFPRFFYVSDDSLLQILSSPLSPSSLTRHLPTLFTNTRSLVTCRPNNKGEDPVIITAVESVEGERLNLTDPVSIVAKKNVCLAELKCLQCQIQVYYSLLSNSNFLSTAAPTGDAVLGGGDLGIPSPRLLTTFAGRPTTWLSL